MEGERTGPLSYDLTVGKGDSSAQRGIVFGLVTTPMATVVALVGGWVALGYLRNPAVVERGFPAGIVAVSLAVTAWGARNTLRRPRRNALLIVLAVSLLFATLTQKYLTSVKVAIPQVRAVVEGIDLPEGFRLAGESTRGDRFCRRGCPTVEQVYDAPVTDPDPVRTLVLAMFAQGWERTTDVAPEDATVARRRGVVVSLTDTGEHRVELTATRDS